MKKAKVVIVGCGSIGSATAWSLYMRHEDLDISFVNRNQDKAWAKAFDMSHCSPFLPHRNIQSETAAECTNADLIIMTAGALPKENGTRTDVLRDNVAIFQSVLPELGRNNPQAKLLNITNPVDSMAYAAGKIAGLPANQVMGSGTELDSMRLRHFTAQALGLDVEKLQMLIVGEHGDSMVPLWSLATYNGIPLSEYCPTLNDSLKAELMHKTKRAGWDIRLAGEHSCYGIAFSAVRITETILGYLQQPICVSSEMETSEAGRSFISLPTKLTLSGIVGIARPNISADEEEKLSESMMIVQKQLEAVDNLIHL